MECQKLRSISLWVSSWVRGSSCPPMSVIIAPTIPQTRSMAHTFASRFVTVNAIAPGRFPSRMTTQGTGADPELKGLAETEQPSEFHNLEPYRLSSHIHIH